MNRLVEQTGLHWMVDRICSLRNGGQAAEPRIVWQMIQGRVYLAFTVVRGDGTFERPPAGAGEPELEAPLIEPAQPECTGFAATWCPIHGDCRCPKLEDGSRNEDEYEGCPLHADDSAHGWVDDAGLRR